MPFLHRSIHCRAAALLLLLAVLALPLCGCGAPTEALLSYQAAPFRAEISGTREALSFRGLLEVAYDPADPAALTRTLTFSEPPALAGVSVTDRAGGQITRAGSPLPAADLSGWLLPLTAFDLHGTPQRTEDPTTLQLGENGRIYTLTLQRTDTAWQPSAVRITDPAGAPLLDLQVVWFDAAP